MLRTILLIAPLAACGAAGANQPVAEDTCGASELQDLVGQPESVLSSMTFPDRTRFLTPDMAVTMDYSAERLNVLIDEDGLITALRCG